MACGMDCKKVCKKIIAIQSASQSARKSACHTTVVRAVWPSCVALLCPRSADDMCHHDVAREWKDETLSEMFSSQGLGYHCTILMFAAIVGLLLHFHQLRILNKCSVH